MAIILCYPYQLSHPKPYKRRNTPPLPPSCVFNWSGVIVGEVFGVGGWLGGFCPEEVVVGRSRVYWDWFHQHNL
ncbi:hypothetical protein AKJ16_DCAP25036 [Drosera capensis]